MYVNNNNNTNTDGDESWAGYCDACVSTSTSTHTTTNETHVAILAFPNRVGGYANFRQSFPEWCEDEVINANLQSGCAATEQLMGLR